MLRRVPVNRVVLAVFLPLLLAALAVTVNNAMVNTIAFQGSVDNVDLRYGVDSYSGTPAFIVHYMGNYTIHLSHGEAELVNVTYREDATYYIDRSRVDNRTLAKYRLGRNGFIHIMCLDTPGVYFIGRSGVEELLHGDNYIDLVVGNKHVKARYIRVGDKIIVYRGTDYTALKKLGNVREEVVLARIGAYNGSSSISLDSLPVSVMYHSGTGIALRIGFENDTVRLTARLENYDEPSVAKPIVLSHEAIRLTSIDYGKHVILGVGLWFAAMVVWMIMLGLTKKHRLPRKPLCLAGSAAVVIGVAVSLLHAASWGPAAAFLGLSLCILSLTGMGRDEDYLAALSASGFLVLALFQLIIPVYFTGSLYKLGIEAGVAQLTDTNVTADNLVAKGISPLLISGIGAYYVAGLINVLSYTALLATVALVLLLATDLRGRGARLALGAVAIAATVVLAAHLSLLPLRLGDFTGMFSEEPNGVSALIPYAYLGVHDLAGYITLLIIALTITIRPRSMK